MKVVRPPSFIPYGPLGHPDAKFYFEYEGSGLEEVTLRYWRDWPTQAVESLKPGACANERDALAEDGYYILYVEDGVVQADQVAQMKVPAKFVPALPSAPGRKLEDFPYTVPGYYQHYGYEPFTNTSPDCDHDFGLEAVRYVFKVDETGELRPLEQVRGSDLAKNPGKVYLTVKCTRCGDVHAIEQSTASGETELHGIELV